MKKINDLQINSDRLMKNEELITLCGGSAGQGACCMCYALHGVICLGAMAATSEAMCLDLCEYLEPPFSYGVWSC